MQGSLRERAPGVWEVRVRSGRDPLTGRCQQVSRTVHGEKRAAEAQLARLATEIDNGAHRGTSESVGYLLDRWAEHLEMLGRSPKTIDGYRSIIRARLRPALGSVALRRLQPADLDRFYRALSQTGSPPLGPPLPRGALGGASPSGEVGVDRPFARRARDPAAGPAHRGRPPSAEEVSQLLRELERTGHDLASMVFVAATTGCRRGELCALRWSDIDLDDAVLVVSRSISEVGGKLDEKDPKTHRARRLSLDPRRSRSSGATPWRCASGPSSSASRWRTTRSCGRCSELYRAVASRSRDRCVPLDAPADRLGPRRLPPPPPLRGDDPRRCGRRRPDDRGAPRACRPGHHALDLRPLPRSGRSPGRGGHGPPRARRSALTVTPPPRAVRLAAYDPAGTPIVLAEERWTHIAKGHPEIVEIEHELAGAVRA